MGKKGDLSPRKVALIKVLLDQKRKSQREIAKRPQISPKSEDRVSQAVKNGHGYSPARVRKCRRKTKLSPRTQHKLVQMARKNRRANSQDLQKYLEKYRVEVCASTVLRKLISAGLPARRPRKKAKITPAMAKNRLNWAYEVKSHFADDWSKVKRPDYNLLKTYEVNFSQKKYNIFSLQYTHLPKI
jgi:DNA-directed RNA polymerase I, II, and III subunit RPABC1